MADGPDITRRSVTTVLAALAGSGGRLAARPAAKAPPADDLATLSLSEASRHVDSGTVSPVALTQACLARIRRHEAEVNAFITLTAASALDQARDAQAEIQAGRRRGPLHGIPIALKDNIDTAGVHTTAASAVFADRVPVRDAEVVRRLKAAGAVILGKLNMGEFAISESVVSHWGAVHNPWNLAHEAGGSSSGAGAAVAAGFCYGAIGTDTAGSIRMPASHCGVVGLKPTYGLVSNRGTVPLMDSLDHVGPLARSVRDSALLLAAIEGHDAEWDGSIASPRRDPAGLLGTPVAGWRLGVLASPFFDDATPDIQSAFGIALSVLRGLGTVATTIAAPTSDVDVMALYAGEAYAFHRPLLKARRAEYQPSNRNRFDGPPEPGSGWDAAANYVAARNMVLEGRRAISAFFANTDLLVLPTMPYEARGNGQLLQEVNAGGGIMPSNTRLFDVLGLPAISLPCGFTRNGLPIGLQIVGPPLADDRVLALADAFEQATDWHRRRPSFRTI